MRTSKFKLTMNETSFFWDKQWEIANQEFEMLPKDLQNGEICITFDDISTVDRFTYIYYHIYVNQKFYKYGMINLTKYGD